MNNLNKHKEKEISCFDEINVSKDLKVEKTFYQQKNVIIKRGTRGVVVDIWTSGKYKYAEVEFSNWQELGLVSPTLTLLFNQIEKTH